MAEENFKAAVNSIRELFEEENVYEIPYYQRPYVWDTEKVGQLFDDIYDHFISRKEDEYFLGCIVLAEQEKKSKKTQKYYEVIDGQQRIISLQLLLTAILLQLEKCNYDANRISKIRNPSIENEEEWHRKASRRIVINTNKLDNCYLQNLQTPNMIEDTIKNQSPGSPASAHMRDNIKWLLEECLADSFKNDCEKLDAFAWHILDYCAIVRVETTNVQIAIGIFSTLNARGMALQDVDIIKARVIGELQSDKDYAVQQWQNMESQLENSEVFNDMLIQYRMEQMEKKSSVALINDYIELIPNDKNGEKDYYTFLQKLIQTVPHFMFVKNIDDYVKDIFAENDDDKKNKIKVFEETCAKDIYRMIAFLNTHENSDWVPVTMCLKRSFDNARLADPNCKELREQFSSLLQRMEALATYFRLKKVGRSHRLSRYFKIIKEIKALKETPPTSENLLSLKLTDDEKKNFREMLDGPIYDSLGAVFTKYILLHLNQWCSDRNESAYSDMNSGKKITIEHVLPQNDSDSYWQKKWTEDERKYWLHRIGNLCLISSGKNTSNRNHAYHVKKENTSRTKSFSSYIITRASFAFENYTAKECQQLQENRLKILYEGWGLN